MSEATGEIRIEGGLRDVPVPIELMTDHELSTTARVIFGILMWHGATPERCYPGHARIGALVGIEERSVARPLAQLERRGWIKRERRTNRYGNRSSDGYTLYLTRREQDSSSVPTATSGASQPRSWARPKRAPARAEQSQGERLQEEQEPAAAAPAAGADGRLFDAPSSKPERSAESARATAITRTIYDARDPKPTAPFVGVVQIVKSLLAAGWPESEIVAAGTRSLAMTRNSFEVELNKNRKPAKRSNGKPSFEDEFNAFFKSGRNGAPKQPAGPAGSSDPIDVREAR